MGILDGLLGSIVEAGASAVQQVAQNAFNASEAEKARAFNSNEAKLAYERSLEADSTKYQRTVADMASAGVNPMMAVSNGAGSSVAAPAATGPAASGASVNLGNLVSALAAKKQALIQEKVANADIAVKQSQKENIDADTNLKKQSESESSSRQRGIDLDNMIKEYTQQERVESVKLDNDLKKANRDLIYGKLDEAIANMQLRIKEAATEEERRLLVIAERNLKSATAWQIYQLTPSLKALNEAKTQEAKGAAAASFAHAAYEQGLIDNGYIDAVVKKAKAEAGSAVDRELIDDIQAAIRTGDWSKVATAEEAGSNILESILSGLTIVVDNLNPLGGLLK